MWVEGSPACRDDTAEGRRRQGPWVPKPEECTYPRVLKVPVPKEGRHPEGPRAPTPGELRV